MKIVDYFYNRSEIDEKIGAVNTELNKLALSVDILKTYISEETTILSAAFSTKIDELESKKQDKIVDKANKVIISDANKTIVTSNISTSELNCLSGITQNIQTELDKKAPLYSPAFEGIPTAPSVSNTDNGAQITTVDFVKNTVSGYMGAPDYSNVIEVTDNPYTAPSNGWFRANYDGLENSTYVTINEVYTASMVCGDYVNSQILLPVAKGDKISWKSAFARFIPCK